MDEYSQARLDTLEGQVKQQQRIIENLNKKVVELEKRFTDLELKSNGTRENNPS